MHVLSVFESGENFLCYFRFASICFFKCHDTILCLLLLLLLLLMLVEREIPG